MTAPSTYAEWLPLLDRFRSGDDAVLDVVSSGSIEWTNVVAERWTAQVRHALDARLDVLSRDLQRRLDRARGDAFAIGQALLAARRGLVPLRAFAGLPAMPPQVRSHLVQQVETWATRTQESLEASARKQRDDRGALLKLMRDHRIDGVAPTTAAAAAEATPADPSSGQRRRLLL